MNYANPSLNITFFFFLLLFHHPSLLPYQLFSLRLPSFLSSVHPTCSLRNFPPSFLHSSSLSQLTSLLLTPFFVASPPHFIRSTLPSNSLLPFRLNDPRTTRAAESDRARTSLIRTNQRGRRLVSACLSDAEHGNEQQRVFARTEWKLMITECSGSTMAHRKAAAKMQVDTNWRWMCPPTKARREGKTPCGDSAS